MKRVSGGEAQSRSREPLAGELEGGDRERTNGLTDGDMIEAISETYGRALLQPSEGKSVAVPSSVASDNYAEIWADEILPIAREAHARLEFRNVKPLLNTDRIIAAGNAVEKPTAGQASYRAWAINVVRDELHRAGWRLADLLQKTL